MDDWRSASVNAAQAGAFQLLEELVVRPQEFDVSKLENARNAGLSDSSIQELSGICFHYQFLTRMIDAFHFPLPTEKQQTKVLDFFNFVASIFGNSSPQEFCIRGTDEVMRPPELEKARQHLLTVKGDSAAELRLTVERYSARAWGAKRPDAILPEPLHSYVGKVARNAYKVLDRDIEKLKNDGYSEEIIFELTLACAFGAAIASVEAICRVYEPA